MVVAAFRKGLVARPVTLGFILLVLTYETVWGLGWAILDIAVRMGVWPEGLFGFEAESFIASVTFWQEVAFFSGVIANVVSLVLFLRLSRWTLPVFGFAVVMDKIDWFMLADNFSYDTLMGSQAELSGYATLLAHAVALYLLFQLRQRKQLR